MLREIVENITHSVTTDFTRIGECDGLPICVPTPLNKFRKPDMILSNRPAWILDNI